MPVFMMFGCLQITSIEGWTTDCFRLNDKVVLTYRVRSRTIGIFLSGSDDAGYLLVLAWEGVTQWENLLF